MKADSTMAMTAMTMTKATRTRIAARIVRNLCVAVAVTVIFAGRAVETLAAAQMPPATAVAAAY